MRRFLGSAFAAALLVGGALLAGPALATAQAETVWLCKPGLAHNPCLASEETTVVLGNGSSFVIHPRPAAHPPIDCFYVYPTVSSDPTLNAPDEVQPEEEAVAESQASRFSQDCAVYAPIYPQLTLLAINSPTGIPFEAVAKAYSGVRAAFLEYLARYNDGRPFVLIGHSQGAAMLIQLVKELIEPNPAVRAKLVSAIILGGNVIVPEGKPVGGTFKQVPACQAAWETGCVIAYSSFLREPPNPSLFGRPTSPLLGVGAASEVEHPEVLCVNPTLLVQNGGEGPLFPFYPTRPFPGLLGAYLKSPSAPTPWVATPGEYAAQCLHRNGATWLQLNFVGPPNDPRERLTEPLGPEWGTHLVDVNVALGNLVGLVRVQTFFYFLLHHRGF
jgi:hypothetical protein